MDLIDYFYEKYKDYLYSIKDLTGANEPTFLFFVMVFFFGYLLKNNPEETMSMSGFKIRNYLNKVIKLFGPKFLMNEQVFEDRNWLDRYDYSGNCFVEKLYSDDIALPDEPVIWVANHAFKDDTLASVLAAKRNAYVMFGSLPQFYTSIDGFTAWINGVAMTNRKVKSSKKASLAKSDYLLEHGKDLFMFPEGVWNKSPNMLLLDFWPGVYHVSKARKAKVIPVVHYIADLTQSDKTDKIHTVVDEPIALYDMEEKEAIEYLKEVMGTWLYLMMEKYGQDTRARVLRGFETADDAWEEALRRRIATTFAYDISIETAADYRDREQEQKRLELIDSWETIANIPDENINSQNVQHVLFAREKVKELKRVDFQRRF